MRVSRVRYSYIMVRHNITYTWWGVVERSRLVSFCILLNASKHYRIIDIILRDKIM